MLNWHKKIMKMVMDKFNLSTYDMAIFAYFDGILTAVIIYEFILSLKYGNDLFQINFS